MMTDISLRDIELILLQASKQPLHQFVQSVTMEDIDTLANVLGKADGSYIDRLNHAAADLKNPVFMLATVKSSTDEHGLSFHETISMLDVLSKLEDKSLLTPDQLEDCAAWLIAGYPTKQGMNLLTELASVAKPGSAILGSLKVDEALSSHFTKAAKRPLEWADFLKLCDWLPSTHLTGALKTIVRHYKSQNSIEEIQQMFTTCYRGRNFGASQINAYRETIGSEMLISLSQNAMLTNDIFWAALRLKDNLGEGSLYSDNFSDQIEKQLAQPLPNVPGFMKALCKHQSDLDEWPITARLMVENYAKVFGYKGAVTHIHLDNFAIKNGMQSTLIGQKIIMLRSEFVSLDDWNFEEMKAKTPAEIFTMGSLSKGHQRREARYNELLQACKGVDLIEMKDMLGNVSGDVVMAINDISGGFANKKEVLKHYPQAKALFLEHDLGM